MRRCQFQVTYAERTVTAMFSSYLSRPFSATGRATPLTSDRGDTAASLRSNCVICSQLAVTDERYFARLMGDARARATLVASVSASMGFCDAHALLVASLGNTTLDASLLEARHHLASLFARATLHDELTQEILFSARSRCPACAYFHRSEGRAAARVLRDLEHEEQEGRQKRTVPPPLCFVHMRMVALRAQGSLHTHLTRLLRAKARVALDAADDIARQRAAFYPLERNETLHAPTLALCPVCQAIATARDQWRQTAAQSVQLAQPGWIVLPTCRTHLMLCLAHADHSVRRAAFHRYFEVTLTGRPLANASDGSARRRRRRGATRWFDTARGAEGRPHGAEASGPVLRESCPGCGAEEIASRRAIARLNLKVSRAQTDDAAVRVTSDLCLKHFAEALIYASDPRTEQRLAIALDRALRER